MEHDVPWQIFSQNGQPINGGSAAREEFAADVNLVMAASHVWIWRFNRGAVEVLLQKRARDKKSWPGFLDIPAAGHIDANETPVESAIREAKEEIGISILPDDLYYIFSLRTPLDKCELDTVYLYELKQPVEFNFSDGEVESLTWVTLDQFITMANEPNKHRLVPQGEAYFMLLVAGIKRLAGAAL